MELENCIKERRSIRSFKDTEVEIEKVVKVIESAKYAPSAGNVQNWSFIIVKDKKKKSEIATACLNQYWLIDAPVLIVVANKLEKIKRLYGSRGESIYSTQSCSAAIENMLLTAYDLGLGSTWVGAFDENEVKRYLKIPNDVKVEGIIALGYSKEEEEIPKRMSTDKFVYFEEWDKKEINTSIWPLVRHKEAVMDKIKNLFSK